jgi:hypothetical protein
MAELLLKPTASHNATPQHPIHYTDNQLSEACKHMCRASTVKLLLPYAVAKPQNPHPGPTSIKPSRPSREAR